MTCTRDAPFAGLSARRSVTPERLWATFAELRTGRPDLQVLSWMLGPDDEVLPWVHSVGVSAESSLRALVPALPPDGLRQITAATETEIFLWTGFVDLTKILELFALHHRRPDSDGWDILDFGCGCGRLTRFFVDAPMTWRAHGSEVNVDHVAWCSEALVSVDTQRNHVSPPLAFTDASLDLVFSVSVWSHLSATSAADWIVEMARVLRPGGILVFTSHGDNVLRTIESSEQHQQMFRMTPAEAVRTRQRMFADGLVHVRYDPDVLAVAHAGDDYGNTFVTGDHVRDKWLGSEFELCAHLPAGMRGWQDVSVLRRR